MQANKGGISVYNRYIPPEEVPIVEKAVLRNLRKSLRKEGDIKGRSAIQETAYIWTQERVRRY